MTNQEGNNTLIQAGPLTNQARLSTTQVGNNAVLQVGLSTNKAGLSTNQVEKSALLKAGPSINQDCSSAIVISSSKNNSKGAEVGFNDFFEDFQVDEQQLLEIENQDVPESKLFFTTENHKVIPMRTKAKEINEDFSSNEHFSSKSPVKLLFKKSPFLR